LIRVEETTVEQINRALQAIETLARGGGKTTPYTASTQVSTVNWFSIIAKPGTFPPSAHEHPISDVIGLAESLEIAGSTGGGAGGGGGGGGGAGGVTSSDFSDHQRLNIMGVY